MEKSLSQAIKSVLCSQTPLQTNCPIEKIDHVIQLSMCYKCCAYLLEALKNFSDAFLLYNHAYFLACKYLGFSNILTYKND